MKIIRNNFQGERKEAEIVCGWCDSVLRIDISDLHQFKPNKISNVSYHVWCPCCSNMINVSNDIARAL